MLSSVVPAFNLRVELLLCIMMYRGKKSFRKNRKFWKENMNNHLPKPEFTRARCDSDTHMTDYDRNGPSPWTHLAAGSHIVRSDGVRRWR